MFNIPYTSGTFGQIWISETDTTRVMKTSLRSRNRHRLIHERKCYKDLKDVLNDPRLKTIDVYDDGSMTRLHPLKGYDKLIMLDYTTIYEGYEEDWDVWSPEKVVQNGLLSHEMVYVTIPRLLGDAFKKFMTQKNKILWEPELVIQDDCVYIIDLDKVYPFDNDKNYTDYLYHTYPYTNEHFINALKN
jgi:hypothetical protein